MTKIITPEAFQRPVPQNEGEHTGPPLENVIFPEEFQGHVLPELKTSDDSQEKAVEETRAVSKIFEEIFNLAYDRGLIEEEQKEAEWIVARPELKLRVEQNSNEGIDTVQYTKTEPDRTVFARMILNQRLEGKLGRVRVDLSYRAQEKGNPDPSVDIDASMGVIYDNLEVSRAWPDSTGEGLKLASQIRGLVVDEMSMVPER